MERIVSIIYGVDCLWDFDKIVYFSEKWFLVDGCQKCKDLFNCFIKENDVVRFGKSIKRMYSLFYENDIEIMFGFYIIRNFDCKFIIDLGVIKIGSVKVQLFDILKG